MSAAPAPARRSALAARSIAPSPWPCPCRCPRLSKSCLAKEVPFSQKVGIQRQQLAPALRLLIHLLLRVLPATSQPASGHRGTAWNAHGVWWEGRQQGVETRAENAWLRPAASANKGWQTLGELEQADRQEGRQAGLLQPACRMMQAQTVARLNTSKGQTSRSDTTRMRVQPGWPPPGVPVIDSRMLVLGS